MPGPKVAAVGSTLIGLACLVAFASSSGQRTPEGMNLIVGWPDTWFHWAPDGFTMTVSRWSVVLGVLGVVLLRVAWRLRRKGVGDG